VRFTMLPAALFQERLSASRSRVRRPSYCTHGGASGSRFRDGRVGALDAAESWAAMIDIYSSLRPPLLAATSFSSFISLPFSPCAGRFNLLLPRPL
jgi:hypothetical protein